MTSARFVDGVNWNGDDNRFAAKISALSVSRFTVCRGRRMVKKSSVSRWRRNRIAQVAAGRFGDPSELGEYCAYLCSAQAGFITGQNLLIDGGKYPGTF